MAGFSGFSLGGIGAPCCCGGTPSTCCLVTCSPCAIPRKDLQVDWTNLITGNGSVAMTYSGTSWQSACSDGLIYSLTCTGGATVFTVTYFTAGSCPTGTTSSCSSSLASPHKLTLTASACSPLSLTYSTTSATCPAVTSSGYTQFVVSDPSPVANPPGLMCQTFTFTVCGVEATSATVDVYDVMGGTLVASGTAATSGIIRLWWQGAAGSYYVTASASSVSFAGTLTLACAGTTAFSGVAGGICCSFGDAGACPIPQNLTLTDANGSYPFTYNGSGWIACTTVSSASVSTLTSGPCTPSAGAGGTIPITYVGTCNVVAGVPQFNVDRWWMGVSLGAPILGVLQPPFAYVAPTVLSCAGPSISTSGGAGWVIPCIISASPANPFLNVSGLSQVWSACSPFAWSGTLIPSPGEFTSDPVGGTVAVAA